MDLDYSELDFEYLPNGGWGNPGRRSTGPRGRPSARSRIGRRTTSSPRIGGSQAGWHTLVTQVADGRVRYFVDGKLWPSTAGKYYPESHMSINFNLWFIKDGSIEARDMRRYHEDIDWVFHERRPGSTPEEVEAKVAAMRRGPSSFATPSLRRCPR